MQQRSVKCHWEANYEPLSSTLIWCQSSSWSTTAPTPIIKVEEHHDSDDKEMSERQWGLVNREEPLISTHPISKVDVKGLLDSKKVYLYPERSSK